MAKNKYTKIGAVLKGEHGPFAVLGNTNGKKEEYNYTVKIQVKNGKGETVMVTNPLLSLSDPRKFKDKDGKTRNISDKLLYELFVVEKTENDSEELS